MTSRYNKDPHQDWKPFLDWFNKRTHSEKIKILEFLSNSTNYNFERKYQGIKNWSDEELILENKRLRELLPTLSGIAYKITMNEYREFKKALREEKIVIKKIKSGWVVERDDCDCDYDYNKMLEKYRPITFRKTYTRN